MTEKNQSPALVDVFIYGEMFELSALIGIYEHIQKYELKDKIELYADLEVDDTSEIYLPKKMNRFASSVEETYKESLNNIRSMIDQITLGEPFDVNQYVSEKRDVFRRFIRITIDYNLNARSNYIERPTESEIKSKIEELLQDSNALNIVLLTQSGYNTGQYFVDFCIMRYGENFSILFETEVEKEGTSKTLKPDIIVVKNGKIVLVGDLKSYFPFLSSKFGSILKDIIGQIPFYTSNSDILDDIPIKINKMYMSRFKSRWNLLLRYFKLLRYMRWIYENASNIEALHPNLDGVILFPSKPILLNISGKSDIAKFQNRLLQTISFDVSIKNVKSRRWETVDLLEYARQLHGLDLKKELRDGDMYIETPEDDTNITKYIVKSRIWNNTLEKSEQKTIELISTIDDFENLETTKTYLDNGSFKTTNSNYFQNARMDHLNVFQKYLSNLNDIEGVKVIVDGSDQGIGKNYSFSKYVAKLIRDNQNRKILFACPRKEAIRQTVEALMINLRSFGIKGKIDYSKLLEGESHIDDENEFRISLVQSDYKGYVISNKYGSLQKIRPEGGKTAREKLNAILVSNYTGLELVMITSDTLPSYLATKRISKSQNTSLKLFQYFDDFVFDELTNSSPTVREVFVDLLKYRALHNRISLNKNLRGNLFLILDASITSSTLFKHSLQKLMKEQNAPYFVPSQEILEEKGTRNYEDKYRIFFQNTNFHVHYIRHLIDYPLKYGVITLGLDSYKSKYSLEILKNPIDNLISQTNLNTNLHDLLENGELLIYVDNKNIIDDLKDEFVSKGYKTKLVTMEEKDGNFAGFNVIGTNALAYGTSFPDKKLMLIFPPTSGSEYYQFKHIIELHRQVMKRMRGNVIETERLVIYHTFPTKDKLSDTAYLQNINIQNGILKNYIKFFINNRFYKQLPSFSSVLNSTNWIDSDDDENYYETIYNIIYHNTDNDLQIKYVPLEIFLKEELPKLKRIFRKWKFYVTESFEIVFNSQNIVKRLPIPGFLPFKLSDTFSPRHFNTKLIHFKKDLENQPSTEYPLEKLREYLNNPPKQDMMTLYNYYKFKDEQVQLTDEEKVERIIHELSNIIKELDEAEVRESEKQSELENRLNSLFSIIHLETSGTSFLLSFEIAVSSEDFYEKSKVGIYEVKPLENQKYLSKLWNLGSPIKTLFTSSSDYFELPIAIRFRNSTLHTVGFLCYYPRFSHYKPTTRYMQLFRKTLIQELFRENVVYIPNLLRDIQSS